MHTEHKVDEPQGATGANGDYDNHAQPAVQPSTADVASSRAGRWRRRALRVAMGLAAFLALVLGALGVGYVAGQDGETPSVAANGSAAVPTDPAALSALADEAATQTACRAYLFVAQNAADWGIESALDGSGEGISLSPVGALSIKIGLGTAWGSDAPDLDSASPASVELLRSWMRMADAMGAMLDANVILANDAATIATEADFLGPVCESMFTLAD